ncbi:B12-binding domain-containing radical SAM protein [Streptacidiphilus albus]|uniref:B12-binding domain-containing radical SAM protein n=1 Tax=Streptacidiphilus albus TaxID=105425 RepID=UPI0005A7500C|nr:B12-binding domain-containing radical SAM protein [Streptacidiphilus albus]
MARVALVNLASLPMPGNEPIFPIGLRCVQDALDRAEHDTRLFDFVQDPAAAEDLSWVSEPWDAIGFTIRNIDPIDMACDGHVEHYVAFLDRVRAALGDAPAPLLIGGGPGYSLFADQLLPRLGFDVGVVGPGEQAMLDILKAPNRYRKAGRNITGRSYGGFMVNSLDHPRPLMETYTAFDGAMIGVETRRKTCYQGCVYCPYAYISGDNGGDLKPLELIGAELRTIHASGIHRVFFTDGIFNSELRFAKEVVQLIIDLALPGLTWSAYFTPKPFDDEFAALLAASKVEFVVISPDSLDDRVMRLLGKSFETRHVDKCLERCRQHGIPARVNVVFGGPGETRESVRNSAQYINSRLEQGELAMHLGYRVLPQTHMAQQLSIPDADLVSPTFYPFDPDLFGWVMEDLDSRFMSTRVLMNLMAARSSSRRMTRIPLPQDPAGAAPTEFPYLALSRQLPLV